MEPPLAEDSAQFLELGERFRDDHHVQSILQMLERIECQPLYDSYRGTGSKAYPPDLMLAVVLFMILVGCRSPSQWDKGARDRDQCKLLGRGIQPSRAAWYRFRDRSGKFIDSVHAQMIKQAMDRQTIDPKDGCLDGTYVAASASRHVMLRLKQISSRLQILKRAIATLDDPNQVASKKPFINHPGWLADTPGGRQEQLDRYRLAKLQILNEIRTNRTLPKSLQRDEDRMVLSPADIDAVIGKDKFKVTRPLYNVQYMCDFQTDMILAYGVFRKKNDTGTLLPVIESTQSIVGNRLRRVHADSGYCSLLELEDSQSVEVELFAPVPTKTCSKTRPTRSGLAQIASNEFPWDESSKALTCPAGHAMRQVSRSKDPRAENRHVIELRFEQSEDRCSVCSLADRCLSDKSQRRTVRRLEKQKLLDEQIAKMDTEQGRESQLRRKMQVERRFGDSKKHRGGSQLHGRGLTRVTAETALMVVAQNCLTLYNLEKTSLQQKT